MQPCIQSWILHLTGIMTSGRAKRCSTAKQADFPWMGIWEENYSRTHAPWKGQALARGMEFGVSPMPESRRQMIDRGKLFGVPAYRWLPAKARLEVEYCAVMALSLI